MYIVVLLSPLPPGVKLQSICAYTPAFCLVHLSGTYRLDLTRSATDRVVARRLLQLVNSNPGSTLTGIQVAACILIF